MTGARRGIGLICLLALGVGGAAAEVSWRPATPGHTWSFPRDYHLHRAYRTEWWYVTGHLFPADGDGGALAFQQTFFRNGLVPGGGADTDSTGSAWTASDLVLAHASLADPAAGRHIFSEVLVRAMPLLGGFGQLGQPLLAWCRAPAGTPGRWHIALAGPASFALTARDDRRGLRYDLTATSSRPFVLHGDGGFSPKNTDATAASLYFSATRLDVVGTVWRDGAPLAVVGQAWLDREIFTSSLDGRQSGWDWLSLQLDDGRDLMLYRLRDTDGGTDYALGTLVAPDGTSTTLAADDWTWRPGATWTSGTTGAVYPVAWRLQVPGADLDLELRATMSDQENVSTRSGVHYWEGAMEAVRDGRLVGRGFVELTGYGEGSRPPLGR